MIWSWGGSKLLLIHSASVALALLLAWPLRFDFPLPQLRLVMVVLPLLIVIRWLAMSCFRLTHGYWRYTGIGDLIDLLCAIVLGSLTFFAVTRALFNFFYFRQFESGLPLSIYVAEGTLSFLLLAALRVNARIFLQAREARGRSKKSLAPVRVLIVGAGSASVELLKALKRTNYEAVGLLDDDYSKRMLKLAGVPVVGMIDELPKIAHRSGAEEVLIAIPSATGAEMIRITDICKQSGLRYRAVPRLADLIDGTVTISEFRNVNLDDLLGRVPVRLESEMVREKLRGRVVMVTGAAGSIGSELCKQLARYQIAKLVCVDQSETPLFNLQQHGLGSAEIEVVYSVADVADTDRMKELLIEHRVRVIFHAAAYKHVPMTESNPYEGLRNNVFALRDLVETAEECGCQDFLLISSDKAVNPSSLMGCTKRLGEMIVGSLESARMRCISTRFGNVLGSQGSVIPLFQEQIRNQGCVTVTHPEMTRYFMTISESVSLVLQAFTVGENGDILVLDMGEPVRILDVAKTLIRISGKREDEIQIVFSGIRRGEKLHEELFYANEVHLATPVPKVLRANGILPRREFLNRHLDEIQVLPFGGNSELVRAKIKQLIPEYQWAPEAIPEMAGALPTHAGLDFEVHTHLKTVWREQGAFRS